jgi:hypothetical protein
VSIAVAVVVLGLVAGCSDQCSGTYGCPDDSNPFATLSAQGLSSPLVEVSADSPCTATPSGEDGGMMSVLVVDDAFNETSTCHVHGLLADGRAVSATVTFRAATLECCPGFSATGGAFVITDAGTDGP